MNRIDKNRIVYTMCSKDYLALFDLWYQQASPYLRPFVLIVRALDQEAYDHLSKFPLHLLFDRQPLLDRDTIWLLRLNDIIRLLDEYDTLIHSDLDAFWLTDPLQILSRFTAPLVFSREHGIPARTRKKWGFSLCCGFFIIRRTEGMEDFFTEWKRYTQLFGDDQLAVNYLLLKKEVTFFTSAEQDAAFAILTISKKPIEIAVLGFSFIDRVFPVTEKEKITHPWFERRLFQAYLILLAAVQRHFGRLNPSWEELQIAPQLMEQFSRCDQCSLNTLVAIEWFYRHHNTDPQILYLQGALLDRCGYSDVGISHMVSAYRLAPDALNLAALIALAHRASSAYKKELVSTLSARGEQEKIGPSETLKLALLLIRNGQFPFWLFSKRKELIRYLKKRLIRLIYGVLQ